MSLMASEPTCVQIQDRILKCQVCGHDEFHKRKAQLNTSVASFLGFDWANRSAQCYVCAKCGYIHWFLV
ncbi:MAG: hypothetical protein AAB466_11510 [Verrucomicrobiota bacterium]